jgi:hypothetical protein
MGCAVRRKVLGVLTKPDLYKKYTGGPAPGRSANPWDSYDLQLSCSLIVRYPTGRVLSFEGFKIVLRWGIKETRPGARSANRRFQVEK